MTPRLVAVLGYSDRKTDGLHPISSQRLRHAEGLVTAGDVVLLSGWGRRERAIPEAELMRAAWRGPDVQLIADDTARNTRGNAASVAAAAGRVAATEVVLVTSWWHAFRARMLLRAALPGVAITSSSPRGRPPLRLLARELACLAAVPVQARRLERERRDSNPRPPA